MTYKWNHEEYQSSSSCQKGWGEELLSKIKFKSGLNFLKIFSFPYGFYSDKEYKGWLRIVGFKIKRVELIEKDMIHKDEGKFGSWIRTTWLHFSPADGVTRHC